MRRRELVLAPAAALPARKLAAQPPGPPYDQRFWATWGDGQAELCGYDLRYPRYGKLRRGSAVAIFVTEMFSNSLRVKADPGKHPAADQFPALKLNLVCDFQTGVYDYNEMTSAFVALGPVNGRPAGQLTKVSFSSQEWCGHAYAQMLFDRDAVRATLHSYFDGEADRDWRLGNPAGGTGEDALLLWARGMAWPLLAPGERRGVELLGSLQASRHAHSGPAWSKAVLERAKGARKLETPAGTFVVETLTARVEGGAAWTFSVEQAAPHRVVAWAASTGEQATLLGSARMKYWELQAEGAEQSLQRLGLAPRPPRTT
jgi:hypothetical protein